MLTRHSPVLIIVIIVVAVVVYYFVTHPNTGNKKRSIVEFAGEHPVSTIYAQSKIPDIKWRDAEGVSAPLAKFSGAMRRSIAGRIVLPKVDYNPDAPTVATATLPVAIPN